MMQSLSDMTLLKGYWKGVTPVKQGNVQCAIHKHKKTTERQQMNKLGQKAPNKKTTTKKENTIKDSLAQEDGGSGLESMKREAGTARGRWATAKSANLGIAIKSPCRLCLNEWRLGQPHTLIWQWDRKKKKQKHGAPKNVASFTEEWCL